MFYIIFWGFQVANTTREILSNHSNFFSLTVIIFLFAFNNFSYIVEPQVANGKISHLRSTQAGGHSNDSDESMICHAVWQEAQEPCHPREMHAIIWEWQSHDLLQDTPLS